MVRLARKGRLEKGLERAAREREVRLVRAAVGGRRVNRETNGSSEAGPET